MMVINSTVLTNYYDNLIERAPIALLLKCVFINVFYSCLLVALRTRDMASVEGHDKADDSKKQGTRSVEEHYVYFQNMTILTYSMPKRTALGLPPNVYILQWRN